MPRNTQIANQSDSSPAMIRIIAWALCLLVLLLGWPGVVLLLAGNLLADSRTIPPQLSGPKDDQGNLTPADQRERKAMSAYRNAQEEKQTLSNPLSLIPGLPLSANWIAALLLGALVATIAQAWVWSHLINGVVTMLVVLGYTAGQRVKDSPTLPMPLTTTDHWVSVAKTKTAMMVFLGVLGAILGACVGVGLLVATHLPQVGEYKQAIWGFFATQTENHQWITQAWSPPGWVTVVASALIGLVIMWWPLWRKQSRYMWKLQVEAAKRWAIVWQTKKFNPVPQVIHAEEIMVNSEIVGRVETLQAGVDTVNNIALNAQSIAQSVTTTAEEASNVAIIPAPALDENGQPVEGQRSNSTMRVVTWMKRPQLLDSSIDEDVARLLIESAAGRAGAENSVALPMVESMTSFNKNGGGGLWQITMSDSWGDGFASTRLLVGPSMAEWLGVGVAIDTTPKVGGLALPTRIIIGDFSQADEIWDEEQCPIPDPHKPLQCRYCGGTLGKEHLCPRRQVTMPGESSDEQHITGLPDPHIALPSEYLENIALEDQWASAWRNVMGKDASPPVIAHNLCAKERLATNVHNIEISCMTFATPSGVDVNKSIIGTESKLLSRPYLSKTAALSVTALVAHKGSGSRLGDRNPNGVRVLSSMQPLPQPHMVPPQEVRDAPLGTAAQWMWTIQLNRAFDDLKIARPEVVRCECLTDRMSNEHIWQVELRLHGAVTPKKILACLEGIESSLQVPWVSAGELDDGNVMLLAGADPVARDHEISVVKDGMFCIGPEETEPQEESLNPRRIERRRNRVRIAMDLDTHRHMENILYQQYWASATNGARPTLVSSKPADENPAITERVFQIPREASLQSLREAVGKMKSASGHNYIDVRPYPGDATKTLVLFAINDPMPRIAHYDFESVCDFSHIPFGVNTSGATMAIDLPEFTHLLVTGTSKSGKTASLLAPLVSMIRAGCQLFVVDYSLKAAADFARLDPWVASTATTENQARALLMHVVNEMARRVALYKSYGGEKLEHIPAEERPPHLIVFFDELSESLPVPSRPSTRPSAHADEEKARLEAVRHYEVRKNIASLINSLLNTGRSAGIHLFLAGQALKADSIPAETANLKTNTSRCLLGNASDGDRKSSLRNPDTAPKLTEDAPPGRGVWDPLEGVQTLVQFWYRTTREYQEWLEANIPHVEKVDVSEYLPSDAELQGFSISAADPIDPGEVEEVSWEDVDVDFSDLIAEGDSQPPETDAEPIEIATEAPYIEEEVEYIPESDDQPELESDPYLEPQGDDDGEPDFPPEPPEQEDDKLMEPSVWVEDSPPEQDEVVKPQPSKKPPPVRRNPVSMEELLG